MACRALAEEARDPIVVQWSTMRPSFATGTANRAPSSTTRRSHATASCMPRPMHDPEIAAIVVTGTVERLARTSARRRVNATSSSSLRSAPAQK